MGETVFKFEVFYHFDKRLHRDLFKSLLCLIKSSASYCKGFLHSCVIAVERMKLFIKPFLLLEELFVLVDFPLLFPGFVIVDERWWWLTFFVISRRQHWRRKHQGLRVVTFG